MRQRSITINPTTLFSHLLMESCDSDQLREAIKQRNKSTDASHPEKMTLLNTAEARKNKSSKGKWMPGFGKIRDRKSNLFNAE
ncbi:hypothetical protein PMIT1320_02419 [Prochlorococcus marinus str. MIT 1320]|nr:hypothetical protein PMIT1320_02419 [Prochlorococcus marinus str. MIT 1320]